MSSIFAADGAYGSSGGGDVTGAARLWRLARCRRFPLHAHRDAGG